MASELKAAGSSYGGKPKMPVGRHCAGGYRHMGSTGLSCSCARLQKKQFLRQHGYDKKFVRKRVEELVEENAVGVPAGVRKVKKEEGNMISEKMTGALNKQINAEMYSAYLYLSMSSFASFKGLDGIAGWLSAQAMEEMAHAQKIYDYVNSQGKRVLLDAIEKPPAEFKSPKEIFAQTLEHEQKVTAMINALVDLSVEEKDHATHTFLQWFVTEQVEEEEHAGAILAKFELAGDHVGALFMLDRELGARSFNPSAGE